MCWQSDDNDGNEDIVHKIVCVFLNDWFPKDGARKCADVKKVKKDQKGLADFSDKVAKVCDLQTQNALKAFPHPDT